LPLKSNPMLSYLIQFLWVIFNRYQRNPKYEAN